jgi:hypothetical protein
MVQAFFYCLVRPKSVKYNYSEWLKRLKEYTLISFSDLFSPTLSPTFIPTQAIFNLAWQQSIPFLHHLLNHFLHHLSNHLSNHLMHSLSYHLSYHLLYHLSYHFLYHLLYHFPVKFPLRESWLDSLCLFVKVLFYEEGGEIGVERGQ